MVSNLEEALADALGVGNVIGDSPPALPNPKDGAEDVAGPPVEAPLNRLPAGLGASPSFFPKPKPPPKAGVEDAPGVAPPPLNKPPGLDAGMLDAPPKRPPEPPVLAPAEPNRPPLAGVLEVLLLAVPKTDGVALPVEGAALKSDLFGVLLLSPPLLLLPCWPNVKLMMAVVQKRSGLCVDGEGAVYVGGMIGNA